MESSVRRLWLSEVTEWRAFRLRALKESPDAFSSRYEDQISWPLERWQERVATLATSDSQAMFVADINGRIGASGGLAFDDQQQPMVISMWTAPEARRRGLARLILESIVGWTRAREADQLELWVYTDNLVAIELYLAFGFKQTETIQASPDGRLERRMVLDLT